MIGLHLLGRTIETSSSRMTCIIVVVDRGVLRIAYTPWLIVSTVWTIKKNAHIHAWSTVIVMPWSVNISSVVAIDIT